MTASFTTLWTLCQAPRFLPVDRLMPPARFDASCVDLSTNFCRNPEYGFHPLELGGDWEGRLALKLCPPVEPEDQEEPFQNLTRGQWYGWCDAKRIGVAYYGTYGSGSRRAFLLERLSRHVSITDGCRDEAEEIKAYWNERSIADWARIKGVFLAGGVSPADLQIVLEETGRLVVIDPEMFELSRVRPNRFANRLISDLETALSSFVPTRPASSS